MNLPEGVIKNAISVLEHAAADAENEAKVAAGCGSYVEARRARDAQAGYTAVAEGLRKGQVQASRLRQALEEGAVINGGETDQAFADTLEDIGRGTDWEDYCTYKAADIREALKQGQDPA